MGDKHMRRVVTDRDNIIARMQPVYDAAMAFNDALKKWCEWCSRPPRRKTIAAQNEEYEKDAGPKERAFYEACRRAKEGR